MSTQSVLAPLFVMAAITFALMIGMVLTRRRAVMDKKVDPKDLLVRGANPWPPRAAQFSDAYANSLELPLLFYVVVIIAFLTKQADLIFVVLSWVFVACRVVQAYVHATSNIRKYRSNAFRAGALTLMVLWLYLGLRFVTA